MRHLDMLLPAGRQPIMFQEEGIANVKTLSRQFAWHVRGQGSWNRENEGQNTKR